MNFTLRIIQYDDCDFIYYLVLNEYYDLPVASYNARTKKLHHIRLTTLTKELKQSYAYEMLKEINKRLPEFERRCTYLYDNKVEGEEIPNEKTKVS